MTAARTRPPLDPEIVGPVAAAVAAFAPSVTVDRIPAFRAHQASIAFTDEQIRQGGAYEVAERSVEVDGAALPMLVCRPTAVTGTAPALVYVHGGGMIGGGVRNGLRIPLDLGLALGMVVVSVDYRCAPEFPHPTPVNDCVAGLRAVVGSAGELGLDADRLILGGASAGGGLAAAVALAARDGHGPQIRAQWLRCPMLDDRESASSTEIEGELGWDLVSNRTGWAALLPGVVGTADVDPLAAPARATDLGGLPPAYLEIGSVDIFRDEVVDYAGRIWRAGGTAELHVWSGGHHGYEDVAPASAVSLAAREARVDWFRRQLRP
jgi:acetyl esterase/lipase